MKSTFLKEDLGLLADFLDSHQYGGSTFLITGATGLIGSLCIKSMLEYNRRFPNKINVIALARDPEKVKVIYEEELSDDSLRENVCFAFQDITEPISSELTCDYLIHTANSTSSKRFITNPVEVLESIYIGTKRVLDYGREKQVKGIVYLSSMETFGQVNSDARLKEGDLGAIDLQKTRSCYPEGKRVAELMCRLYAEEYGVPVKVARLAQTFGAGVLPGENRVFAQFARSGIKGENIMLHTMGNSVGNYVYTRDAIQAIFLLLKQGTIGETYTVVNEKTTMRIRDMASLVAETVSKGKSRVIFDIPEENPYGYAADSQMHLSSAKMNALGWFAEVDLPEMYLRMIPDLS